MLRRFIQDCAACLQAVAGDDISSTNLVLAATMMCDTVHVLKDQTPAYFPSSHNNNNNNIYLYQKKIKEKVICTSFHTG